MKSVNEQLAEIQKKTLESLEPMQNMSSVAANAFEKIARKNYDLMGDLVEYAVAQAKLPNGGDDVQQAYEQRMADTRAFAEKVNVRAAEYVELASELGEMVTAGTQAKPTSGKSVPSGKKAAKKKPAAKKRAVKAK